MTPDMERGITSRDSEAKSNNASDVTSSGLLQLVSDNSECKREDTEVIAHVPVTDAYRFLSQEEYARLSTYRTLTSS